VKKFFYLLISTLFLCYGCNDDDNYKTYDVPVQLVYPEGSEFSAIEGLAVQLTNGSTSYDATTDATGLAVFTVPAGIYEASATDKRSSGGAVYLYNGIKSNIVVADSWAGETIALNFTESRAGQVVIKELYVGGCQKDDESGAYQKDKYVILYNNSDLVAELDNLCLGMTTPLNATMNTNYDNDEGGNLKYESEGWIPAGYGIWYLPATLTIEPYSQVVVALYDAIDHTRTYTNSVNLANKDYYCTYDLSPGFTGYSAPSEQIPTSHYFLIKWYGAGIVWSLSTVCPAFFIFKTEGVTPQQFADNVENRNQYNNSSSAANTRLKVPVEWVLDGIEVFKYDATNNKKRLTPAVDGGAMHLVNTYGYTSYRNVDQKATEAIEENAGLLVYNYNKGTIYDGGDASTDPSGIDAEASLKKGARIVYKDTNNSTNDFHQRKQASLRD
jgi:hypothetical protein